MISNITIELQKNFFFSNIITFAYVNYLSFLCYYLFSVCIYYAYWGKHSCLNLIYEMQMFWFAFEMKHYLRIMFLSKWSFRFLSSFYEWCCISFVTMPNFILSRLMLIQWRIIFYLKNSDLKIYICISSNNYSINSLDFLLMPTSMGFFFNIKIKACFNLFGYPALCHYNIIFRGLVIKIWIKNYFLLF